MADTENSTVLELLEAARAKIADPKRWTRHVDALDVEDEEVDPKSKDAVCWCALGAVRAVIPDGPVLDRDRAWALLVGKLVAAIAEEDRAAYTKVDNPLRKDWMLLLNVNDRKSGDDATDHVRILAVFDRAIERERVAA